MPEVTRKLVAGIALGKPRTEPFPIPDVGGAAWHRLRAVAALWPLANCLLVLSSLRERNLGAFSVESCFPQEVGQGREIPLCLS